MTAEGGFHSFREGFLAVGSMFLRIHRGLVWIDLIHLFCFCIAVDGICRSRNLKSQANCIRCNLREILPLWHWKSRGLDVLGNCAIIYKPHSLISQGRSNVAYIVPGSRVRLSAWCRLTGEFPRIALSTCCFFTRLCSERETSICRFGRSWQIVCLSRLAELAWASVWDWLSAQCWLLLLFVFHCRSTSVPVFMICRESHRKI